MEAVAQVGYVPNTAAKSLRSHKTRLVLMVLPSLTEPGLVAVLQEIEAALFEAGYGMIVGVLDGNPKRGAWIETIIVGRQVDGLLSLVGELENHIARQSKADVGLPAVAISPANVADSRSQFETGVRAATQQLMRYLT